MDTMVYRLNTEDIVFRYAEGIIDPPEKEFHSQNEIYFLWEGQISLVSEFGRQHLCEGTAVILPRETFHQFVVENKSQTYIRCNLKFAEISPWNGIIRKKMKRVFTLQDDVISDIFQRLRKLVHLPISDAEKRILLQAYLAELLVLLPSGEPDALKNFSQLSAVTRGAIHYIQQNIAGNLSLEAVASALHLSPSHLSHVFKKDMETPLHRYILSKRLIQANIRIRHGIKPACAAEECGFRDYSNFYVQYKKHFGHPPSKEDTTYTHPEDLGWP